GGASAGLNRPKTPCFRRSRAGEGAARPAGARGRVRRRDPEPALQGGRGLPCRRGESRHFRRRRSRGRKLRKLRPGGADRALDPAGRVCWADRREKDVQGRGERARGLSPRVSILGPGRIPISIRRADRPLASAPAIQTRTGRDGGPRATMRPRGRGLGPRPRAPHPAAGRAGRAGSGWREAAGRAKPQERGPDREASGPDRDQIVKDRGEMDPGSSGLSPNGLRRRKRTVSRPRRAGKLALPQCET
ncbi:hypothetical protein SAMN05444336_11444, partial [Albimonas donghaensis]